MRIPASALAIVGVLLSPSMVSAQQLPAAAPVEPLSVVAMPAPVPPPSDLQRGSLIALSASLASLQAYDAYSTLSAISRGGVERNPLMRGVVQHPAALVVLKGGVAAGSIVAATHLWRQQHRGAAILLLAATNGTMAAVAAHNASVLGTLRANGK